ncbi:MAG: hypothetical protein R3F08_06105 [Dokdonella sp.]
MRIEGRCASFVAIAGLCLVTGSAALAFEPGTRHVCVPSSDGQSFECHDVSAPANTANPTESAAETAPDSDRSVPPQAASPQAASPPVTPPPAAPASVPMAKPVAAATRPPSYLLQRPSSSGVPAAVAEPAANAGAVPAAEPAPVGTEPAVEAAPDESPAGVDADTSPAPAENPAASAEAGLPPATEPAASTAPEPQAIDSDAAETEPVAAESPTEDAATTANEPTAPAPMPRGEVLGADEFARLPGSHYTVVLASVRDPATLGTLIAAMADRPGALYLLKLGMPDGDWYSLCWSEFDDVEAARAARVQLPDEASLSSGWPRRIGLLQAEIAREAANR